MKFAAIFSALLFGAVTTYAAPANEEVSVTSETVLFSKTD